MNLLYWEAIAPLYILSGVVIATFAIVITVVKLWGPNYDDPE